MKSAQARIEGRIHEDPVGSNSVESRGFLTDNGVIHVEAIMVECVHELVCCIHHLFARVILENVLACDGINAPKLQIIFLAAVIIPDFVSGFRTGPYPLNIHANHEYRAVFGKLIIKKLFAIVTIKLRCLLLPIGIHKNSIGVVFPAAPIADTVVERLGFQNLVPFAVKPGLDILIGFLPNIEFPFDLLRHIIKVLAREFAPQLSHMPIVCCQRRNGRRKIQR